DQRVFIQAGGDFAKHFNHDAVKPGIMIKVLSEITSSLNKDSLVVSIAAGVTLDQRVFIQAGGDFAKHFNHDAVKPGI
ncbi:hypothetical protein PSY47_23835, partial [Shigella flexneri]|nr:hypothetical protein [Shigella flexneri]